jgi:hypothetical protein
VVEDVEVGRRRSSSFVDPKGAPPMMSWPSERVPILPVFGDLQALDRAGRELGLPRQRTGVAALRPTELFAWAREWRFAVALGVYPDDGLAKYMKVEPAVVLGA